MTTRATDIHAKAKVYAEVLLEAAKASDRVFAITGEFGELVLAVRGSLELRGVLADAAVSPEAKETVVSEILKGFAPELITIFKVMVERDDLAVLPKAHEQYNLMAEDFLGAVILDVHTAVALDDTLREQIIGKYSKQFGKDVLLREHLDPDLLGGIILSTHGKRIDASVSSQLENARQVLSEAY